MNESEVSRQIEQMVMFIKQEAEEKANEVRMSAEEEFNLEKLNLIESEKQRIRKEYERKEAQVESNKKIESSKQTNEQRLKVLAARQRLIKDVFEASKAELKKQVKGSGYVDMLATLLCQAMIKLQEPSQVVQCRKEDTKAIESAMSKAQQKFKSQQGKEAPQLTLDRKHYLAAGAKNEEEENDADNPTCLGGVVVISPDGRIVVDNTIDTRLGIIQDEQLPAIRGMLFD